MRQNMKTYKASKEFHKHFPEKKFDSFTDILLFLISGRPKIGIHKFTGFLHRKHSEKKTRNKT
jgi:hypothetical protein